MDRGSRRDVVRSDPLSRRARHRGVLDGSRGGQCPRGDVLGRLSGQRGVVDRGRSRDVVWDDLLGAGAEGRKPGFD